MDCLIDYGQKSLHLYQGQLKNNKRQGYGRQTFASDFQFTGNWADDLPQGYGTLSLKDIISYEGTHYPPNKKKAFSIAGN